jgi:hypothetical protein
MNGGEHSAGTGMVVKSELQDAPQIAPSIDDVLASFGDVKRRLDDLVSSDETLWNINNHLALIEQHLLGHAHADYFLRAIEKNTRLATYSAAVTNANFSIMSLVALFWSAFFCWKDYEDIHVFVSTVAAHIARHF